jgi:hypothetical protein
VLIGLFTALYVLVTSIAAQKLVDHWRRGAAFS